MNDLVGHAITSGEVLVKSDGSPWRPLVHVDDIARAFLAVLDAPRQAVHGQAFNVGRNEENYRIREVADMVSEAIPGSRVIYAEGAEPDFGHIALTSRSSASASRRSDLGGRSAAGSSSSRAPTASTA